MNTAIPSKLPPSNIEAEQAYLGSVLLNPDTLLTVCIAPEAFYLEKHSSIYRAMLALYERDVDIDFVTLCAELEKRKEIDAIGGAAYLTALCNASPSAFSAPHYAEEINHTAMQRRIVQAAGNIAGIGFDSIGLTQDEMIAKAQNEITRIEAVTQDDDLMTWHDAISNSFPRVMDYVEKKNQKQFVKTGLRFIDCLMGGLPRGELTLIAGDPGMGKTHLAETIAFGAATQPRNHAGIFFSLEMRREQLLDRHFAERANMHVKDLRQGNFDLPTRDTMFEEVGATENIPLWISDKPRDTASVLRAILKLQRRQSIDFAVVDYSQLLTDHANSEVERNMGLSHSLKRIAKQTDVALIVVHPISREADPASAPELRHLGWGRAWEFDAYFVFFPFFQKNRADSKAIVKIGKWRDGKPGGEQDAYFDGKRWADIYAR